MLKITHSLKLICLETERLSIFYQKVYHLAPGLLYLEIFRLVRLSISYVPRGSISNTLNLYILLRNKAVTSGTTITPVLVNANISHETKEVSAYLEARPTSHPIKTSCNGPNYFVLNLITKETLWQLTIVKVQTFRPKIEE
ncbi:hypothetical protein RUM43_012016 [Polyplax serrata]|uniref:Uncharacterized protein n=1 Tax=Polyplax serrata TaxID=468196 RepID=A0AAN8Q3L3_POLSC